MQRNIIPVYSHEFHPMKRHLLVPVLTTAVIVAIAMVFLRNNKKRQETPTALPNLIFILADDMGYGDPGSLNPESRIQTPNMDRIAREGMYFTDAHSYSGVCTPTRYGILTGRYCFRTRLAEGVLGGHDPSLIEPGRETVATLLRRAGYRTACVGKWHLGLDFKKKDPSLPLYEGSGFSHTTGTGNVDYTAQVKGGPADHGFDFSYILPASLDMQPYIFVRNGRVVNTDLVHIEGRNDKENRIFWRHGDAERGFDFYDVLPRLTGVSMDFIREHLRDFPEQPFFLYFPLTAPHTPHVPLDAFKGISGAGNYGDFVSQVDYSIGQLLDLVDSLGIAGNTLIVLTSDNGARWLPQDIERYGHRANYIFRGMKSDVWEGGHRVPFLARWPGRIEAGSRSERILCLNDLLATCAELTGQKLDWNAGEDSFSFLGALTGEVSGWTERNTLINQSISTTMAIRRDNWKLIPDISSGGWSRQEILQGPPMQLYNLDEDPGEKNNLYGEKPEKAAELQALLDMYIREGRSRFE